MAANSSEILSSHANHALRGPHRQHLSEEQSAALSTWLEEVAGSDQLSVRQLAEFALGQPPLIDAITRVATSVSIGQVSGSLTITHAIALLGIRRTLALLDRLARSPGTTPANPS